MYHYVRPAAPDLPYHPYLHLERFRRQLDHFGETYGLVGRDAFVSWLEGGEAPEGVLLTFDDGLRDHVEFVLPVLRELGLFGIFYMCSSPLVDGSILDVHKVHLTLGRLGGHTALAWVKSNASSILPSADDDYEPIAYAAQNSERETKLLKHVFNWLPPTEEKSAVLDALLELAFEGRPPHWRDIYCDENEIRLLLAAGLAVGPHSHTHTVPALLDLADQRQEIVRSCEIIEEIGGSRSWGYCYPYGLPQALTPESEEAVASSGCHLAFAVSPNDIVDPLRRMRRFALPRHNCNAFPDGSVCYGVSQ
jgi:peptidoglycan/xylan/chitin deacetylase (PgdA/CDA1 family)